MDCRKPFALACALFTSVAGCSHQQATPAPVAISKPVAALPQNEELDPEALKRAPKPETFVAFGDFSAREAGSTNNTAEQTQLNDRARRSYQEAIKTDPNNVAAQHALARLYATNIKDYPRAIATYEAALKLAPKDASLYFELGVTQARSKQWQPASENINRAVELDPENRQYVKYQGFTLARAGRFDESLAAFNRYEGEAKGHYFIAQMLEHMGQEEQAKAHLVSALAKDPQLADAKQMLVRLTVPLSPAGAPTAAPIQTVGFAEEAAVQPPAQLARPTAEMLGLPNK